MQIISRAQWGARPPRALVRTPWVSDRLWVHYTVTDPPAATFAAEAAAIRQIQAYHQSLGWSDIGYAYVIAPYSGRVYEGRGRDTVGAHCPGRNTEASVCILWRSGTALPPPRAMTSTHDLARHLGKRAVYGHVEAPYPTACPGDAILNWVRANRVVPTITPPAKPVAKAPWTVREAGKGVIARGSLNHAEVIRRTAAALTRNGHRAPWVATVDGREIGRGNLWPDTAFKKRVAAELQAGRRVNLNGHNKPNPKKAVVSIAKEK